MLSAANPADLWNAFPPTFSIYFHAISQFSLRIDGTLTINMFVTRVGGREREGLGSASILWNVLFQLDSHSGPLGEESAQ